MSGCAVGPNYKKPQTWTPSQWRDAQSATDGKHSVVVADAPDTSWWNVFHDAELSSLETRLASQNLDVQKATEQLAQSRAQLVLAGAERFPAMSATGSYSRAQYSTKTMQRIISRVGSQSGGQLGDALGAAASTATIPLLDQWRDGVDATWEVDLWGRVRRQYEAAQAFLDETTENRRSLLIAREGDLARDYVTLRGLQDELRIVKRNRDDAAHILEISSARYHSGLVSELDEQNARSQLQATTARIPSLEQQIDLQINAICLLMGMPPASLTTELSSPSAIPPVPPKVPVGVPSDLARRRPDIRAAEAQLHAATAQVGQAEADFYPRVTIDASFGFQSLSFRDMGFWNARAWNVGPSISLPIFQGGRLRGQLELKKAEQKEAAVNYRQVVLSAWRDVDDALVSYSRDQARRDELTGEVQADRRAYELALDRYRHGMTSFLDVLDTERRVLNSEVALSEIATSVSTDLTRLYLSLGGGWESVFPV